MTTIRTLLGCTTTDIAAAAAANALAMRQRFPLRTELTSKTNKPLPHKDCYKAARAWGRAQPYPKQFWANMGGWLQRDGEKPVHGWKGVWRRHYGEITLWLMSDLDMKKKFADLIDTIKNMPAAHFSIDLEGQG